MLAANTCIHPASLEEMTIFQIIDQLEYLISQEG
jgi:hypothetical protein